ncbi:MAG TPA: FliH/SctL family protein [Bryobacteraceae bacterium]|nr:FliH/SctL family protein [Bryobacteraceae bacterium]
MSCKLFSAASAEGAQPVAMLWSTVRAPAPCIRSQALFAPPVASAESDEREELRAKLAAMEQLVREAREAGRVEGEAQGKKAAQAETAGTIQKLASAIHDASELRARLRTQAEGDLVRLAIAIARRIVGRELNADPDAIAGLVKAALERVRVQEILRVKMHPAQSGSVVDYLTRFGATHVEVVSDPVAETGTVIFETSRGNYDASVETQLREIERGLTDRFRGQGQ